MSLNDDIVTLELAKAHLRVENSSEDTLITTYIGAAVNYVEKTIDGDIPGRDDSPQDIPDAIRSAVLLIVADLYENREGASEKEIKENPAVLNLLYPYRDNMGL